MKAVFSLLMAILVAGCATPPPHPDFSAFRAAAPRSIVVLPIVNKSLDVDAPTYMLSTLTIPLAEKGYYVFPINTTKFVLEQEGMYEGERAQQQPPEAIARMFGADAILYVTINRWDAQYVVLSTTVTVNFDYRIVDKNGVELWTANEHLQYSPQGSNTGNPIGNLIGAAITAALSRARPNYLPLTRQANAQAFVVGPRAIPNGPYLPATP